MTSEVQADRAPTIQESLRNANASCLLVLVLLCGFPFVGIGGFFVYLGLSKMHDQARLHDAAIEVPATIVSSEVRRSTTRTGPESGSTMTSFWADIRFTFDYDGKTWSSDQVWPVGEANSEANVRSVVERYPQGASVVAFVNPKDPSVAFLEKRWSQMPYVSVCIGCLPILFLTTLAILLAGWKRPIVATVCALSLGTLVIIVLVFAGEHYSRQVPAIKQVLWIWLLLVGTGTLEIGMLVSLAKARQLNRLYRKSVEAAR
jgi:hypothetical protein